MSGELSAVGEAVWRDVDDPHDERPRADSHGAVAEGPVHKAMSGEQSQVPRAFVSTLCLFTAHCSLVTDYQGCSIAETMRTAMRSMAICRAVVFDSPSSGMARPVE